MLLEEFLRKGDDWVMMDVVKKAFAPKKKLDVLLAARRCRGLADELQHLHGKQIEDRASWKERPNFSAASGNGADLLHADASSPKKTSALTKKSQNKSPKKCMSPKKRLSPMKQMFSTGHQN